MDQRNDFAIRGRGVARRQIGLLVACQGLLYVNNVTLVAAGGLAGLALAPTPLLATVPVTAYLAGSALATMPASLAMGRYGRRAGFVFGAAMGVVGSLIAAAAMLTGSFAGLCVGTFVIGVYNALAQFLRFAAADVADAFDPAAKERAVSWVMAGGIAGGIVGPQLSKLTRDLFPAAFAGSFLALAAAAAVALMLSRGLRIRDDDAAAAQPARPLAQIAVQPAFFVAVLVGAVGFGVMNLLMNASPLAMAICGFGYPDAADAIQWHVIAMFAPGFFTGALIQRFGLHPVMLCGCAAMLGTAAIGSLGTGYWHFWSALVLLGLGWNLMFTGATLLLMRSYRPGEKAKAQGANNLAVSLLQIAASAAAGALVSTRGWAELNLLAAPPIALAGAAIIGLSLHRGRPRVTAAAPADAGARCGR